MSHSKQFKKARKARREPSSASIAFMALAASGLISCAEDGVGARAPDASPETEARGQDEAAAQQKGSSGGVPNDPAYSEQWHLPVIGAPAAWETTSGSSDVIVAIIDTGFDLTHPDLQGAIWTNPHDAPDGVDNDFNGLVDDVHGWSFVTNSPDVKDDPGHGTHVAGLIAAVKNNGISVAGVASGVQILPLAVPDNPYQPKPVAEAIFYAVAHGANIINISMGGPDPYTGVREAIDYAVARDVLVVSSAHNKSESAYNHPAVYQEILAVAATDRDDKRAMLSNYGSWVDIAAAGKDIVSTKAEGGHFAVSGTSQASPIVAGVAALIKSAHPDWTAQQIRTQLLATADDLTAKNPDYVGLLGAGRVNAARAVGPAITDPRPYFAGFSTRELSGDGDQEPSAGDTLSLSVAWRFVGSDDAATAKLSSNDPYVTVTSEAVALSAPYPDRTYAARFTISVAPNTPADHVAELGASLESSGRSVEQRIQLPVAPAYRRLGLAFGYEPSLLPHSSGKLLFVSDEARLGARTRVYAAFRNPDGSFTAEKTLSDPNNDARRPATHVDSNGDIHVVYAQAVNPQEYAVVVGYAKYTATTGEWSRSILDVGRGIYVPKNGAIVRPQQPVAIGRSPNGKLHVAYSAQNELVLTTQVDSTWSEPQVFQLPDEGHPVYPLLDLQFITVGERLELFVHPVPTDISSITEPQPPDYTRKLQMLEYDGSKWSAPVELSAGTDRENAQMPALVGDAIRRFQAPVGGGQVVLAELAGTSWNQIRAIQDLGGVDLQSGFFGLETSQGAATFLIRSVSATRGSTRELWENGVVHPLIGDSKLRAMYPAIFDLSGARFIFNQERRLHRDAATEKSPEGIFYDNPEETSFYSNAPLARKARPSVPLVIDDGVTTTDNRRLHARWSSSHEAGIREYRVAWGSAPGMDDIVPWTVTTRSEDTFDLGEQRLLPGQTVYVSVAARSNAVLASAIGASDGITLANLCVAPEWNSKIAYERPRTRVTYRGATYSSLRPSSGSAPADAKDDWQLVMACEGTPSVPVCKQPKWVSGRVYPAGSNVSHEGFEFVSQSPNDTAPTGTTGNPWSWVRTCQYRG